jgi:ribosomal protein S21
MKLKEITLKPEGKANSFDVTNTDLQYALKQWRTNVKNNGLIEKLRENSYFIPKSLKKRKQHEEATFFETVVRRRNSQ